MTQPHIPSQPQPVPQPQPAAQSQTGNGFQPMAAPQPRGLLVFKKSDIK